MYSAIRAAPAARALARSFSTTQAKLDVAKVTLVGRLGTDPVARKTAQDKDYYTYVIATKGPATKDASGNYVDGPTSWHNVFAFNEYQLPTLSRVGKGSTVYVEADLEMRKSEPVEGQSIPDRVLLRQNTLRVINRVKPESEDAAASE